MLLRVLLCVLVVFAAWTAWGMFRSPVQRTARAFPEPAVRYDFGRVLVVYYSAGGNTAEVAGRIAALTGGELLTVETREDYPTGPALYFKARSELKSGQYPALQTTPPDFGAYDAVFAGAPVWWYSVAAPMLSLLSQCDFAGKPVIPFCTAGGNPGAYFERFAKEARSADVLEGAAFNGVAKTAPEQLDRELSDWLDRLQAKLQK